MFAKPLFAFALTLLPFASAFAEDVTLEAEASFVPGQEAPSFSFPRPDLFGAMPDSVEVKLTVALIGQAGIENVTKRKVDAVLFTSFGADLTSPDGVFQLGAGGEFATFSSLGAFDGADDYIGASGEILNLREFASQRTERLSGKALERFMQSNKSKVLKFNVSGGASFSLLGPEYSVLETHTDLFIKVEVTYRYGEDNPPAKKSPSQAPANQAQLNGIAKAGRGALAVMTSSFQPVSGKELTP